MWALYAVIGFVSVVLYFTIRIEWIYHKYEGVIREHGNTICREQYPHWERALWRYFYIWRFKSLKGKK